MSRNKTFIRLTIVVIFTFISSFCFSATKICNGSGNWNNGTLWTPSGVPIITDNVIINNNYSISIDNNTAICKSLVVNSGATLTVSTGKLISIVGNDGIIINGNLNINSGDITLSTNGAQFNIGTNGSVVWNPGNNTVAGATLFTNGKENFSATGSLKILKWYNYSVPLKNVITGNFGNLAITTESNGYIATWQMLNSFQTNPVLGTLTIDNAYVVLDNSNSISTTTIGNIVLNTNSSYLDLYDGSLALPYTVNTGNVTINGGELDCFYASGTGTGTFNISGDLTITNSGYLVGANSHNGNATVNVKGNTNLLGAHILGVFGGSGNFNLDITGNFTMYKSGSIYSEYNGIVNGNGNTSLTIGGNFSHQGYTSLIFNAGLSGVGNGNAICTIGGSFSQSDGNFCGIWNLTSYNSGSCIFTAGNIDFSGGVFMVHYGCSTSTITNQLIVKGNLTISYTKPTDIFRGIGLSSLNNNNNNASLILEVDGNTNISGNSDGEFTTSAANGNETITTSGPMSITGGNNRFDYSNGNCNWVHNGDINVNGGNVFFSRNSGNSNITVIGDLNINAGNCCLKGNSGDCNLLVHGKYTQTAGTMNLYDNSSLSSSDNVSMSIDGTFLHTGGLLNFSNNSGNTGQLDINLKGENYIIGGTGTMISDGAGASNFFGNLNFIRNGTIKYSRLNSNYVLQQVKQHIKNQCTLQLSTTDFQIASHNNTGTDFLKVENGGVLDLGKAGIVSNLMKSNSGCCITSGGCIKTAKQEGLYNEFGTAAINSSGNMNYNLDANSIVEYDGAEDQTITGLGKGNAIGIQHKYGILKINLKGVPDNQRANLQGNLVYIRTSLELNSGELNLNNHPLTIESGSKSAIIRDNGYIKCESNSAISKASVIWKNIQSGPHIFPFGINSSTFIPLTFSPSAGLGNEVEISTSETVVSTTSFSGLSVTEASTKLKEIVSDETVNNIINRWWAIKANGVVADVTLSYPESENSSGNSNTAGKMMAQSWNGTKWGDPFGTESNLGGEISSVAASGVTTASPIIIVIGKGKLPFQLLSFSANTIRDRIVLVWNTVEEKEGTSYTVERSTNGGPFVDLGKIEGTININSTNSYSFEDLKPEKGINNYRLKQVGDQQYSPVRSAKFGESSTLQQKSIENITVGPNPFQREFNVSYDLKEDKDVDIRLFNAAGQIVLQTKVNGNSGQNHYQFNDDNNLPPGNYILNVISGVEMHTYKLIKAEY